MFTNLTSELQWWWDTSNKPDEIGKGVFTVLTLFCMILSFKLYNNRLNRGKPPLPPGALGLPFLGYLPFLGSDIRKTFKDLASIYGPIFKVRLGTKLGIVITSPSLVKEVVRDQDIIFANRDPTITARIAVFGAQEIAFCDYGPEWRKMKKLFVSEMMSNASLDASYYLRKQQVRNMTRITYKKAGEVVDVGELIFICILGSVMSIVWGDTIKEDEFGSNGAEFRPIIAEFLQILGLPNISDYFPMLAPFDLQGLSRRMKLATDQIEKLLDKAISHYNKTENNRQHFLGYLLELTKLEDPSKSLTLPQVKAILMDAVIGGMDTTATTIEWVLAELLQHPKEMRNVQRELTGTVGIGSCVEEVHLSKLKYLKAVFKETLRLHPPLALLIPHCPSKSTTLGGYTVPKGSQLFINAWAIQRDPQIWEAPLAFQPERFLIGSDTEKLDFLGGNFQYLPFGSGRRQCPGISLAERTSMYVLASLLYAFDWTLPNGTTEVDLSETFGIVVKKTNPLMAIPFPRLSGLDELYSCEN